jgi:hypothetical protein
MHSGLQPLRVVFEPREPTEIQVSAAGFEPSTRAFKGWLHQLQTTTCTFQLTSCKTQQNQV